MPGGTNVIASRVDAWLDLRADVDAATRALLAEVLAAAEEAAAAHGCALEVTEESYVDTVIFDPALRDRLGDVLGGPPVLATGAGHDAGRARGRAADRDAVRPQSDRGVALAVRDRQR